MNQEQKDIVSSTEKKKLIIAGAGTGKTTTLLSAATAHKFDGEIVIITFTNTVAYELKEKIDFQPFFIGTFHSYCYNLLKQYAKKYNQVINILLPNTMLLLIKDMMEHLGYSENNIKKYENYFLNDKNYIDTDEYNFITEVEEHYKKLKEQCKIYDIYDSPKLLNEKLKENNIELNEKYIFIDEAQDLSLEEYELIDRLPIENKFIIGDPKQSIYLFRGSEQNVLDKFIENDYKVFTLKNNHRSYQEILDFSNSGLTAMRGNGGQILDLKDIMPYYPQILCSTNKQVDYIKKFYPYVCTIHMAKGLEWNNVVVVNFSKKVDNEIMSLQLNNMFYVAETRAKNNLCICNFQHLINYLKNAATA